MTTGELSNVILHVPGPSSDPYGEPVRKAFESLAHEYFPENASKCGAPDCRALEKAVSAAKDTIITEEKRGVFNSLNSGQSNEKMNEAMRSPLERFCGDPIRVLSLMRNLAAKDTSAPERSLAASLRADFPILSEKVNGKPLIWFDNAATTQKPSCVIERIRCFYEHENSNVHRGAHTLAERATDAYEEARKKAAGFLKAYDPNEIVFVRGTTEAVNLVAHAYAIPNLSAGDEIVISALEHHSNIVPWHMVCEKTGAVLKVIPVDNDGQLNLWELKKLLSEKVKLLAFTHVSNAIGTVTPARELISEAHKYGAAVLVDGAQAAAHIPVDVRTLDCDFYAFSGHKVFGPTGIGVLYAKADIMRKMRPFQGGGSMIADVTFERTSYGSPPYLFEAGTGSIADAAGLGSALDYVAKIGPESICAYEHDLTEYAVTELKKIPEAMIVGCPRQRSGIISFTVKGHSPDEIGRALDREGIAVRTGHHCAQPILRRFGLEGTIRLSLALYNTFEEVDRFSYTVKKLIRRPLA